MSDARAWLEARTPPPPGELRARLEVSGDAEALHERLTERAVSELARARANPGRVRESAFHLLAADALLTYACEAALEAPEPDRVLAGILRRAASGDA